MEKTRGENAWDTETDTHTDTQTRGIPQIYVDPAAAGLEKMILHENGPIWWFSMEQNHCTERPILLVP